MLEGHIQKAGFQIQFYYVALAAGSRAFSKIEKTLGHPCSVLFKPSILIIDKGQQKSVSKVAK
jgi:hypothetical protein